MLKIITLLLSLSTSTCVLAQTSQQEVLASLRTPGTDALDAKNGFRTHKFNSPISEMPGLKLIESSGDSKYYQLPNDKLSIGTGKLSKIAYGFYKGRLASVTIDMQGESNADAVLEALTTEYGEAKTNSPGNITSHYWYGKDVTLTFSHNHTTHHGSVFFISNQLSDEKKADRAKKAASDL